MKSKVNDVNRKLKSVYSAAGAAPEFLLLANRPAKNCCTILERAKTDSKDVCFSVLSKHILYLYFIFSSINSCYAFMIVLELVNQLMHTTD